MTLRVTLAVDALDRYCNPFITYGTFEVSSVRTFSLNDSILTVQTYGNRPVVTRGVVALSVSEDFPPTV